MTYDTVDVLIVGAGPAGCAVALSAQRIGMTTLMSSPELPLGTHRPRTIETIGRSALLSADRLGILDCFIAARVGSVRKFLRDGRTAELEGPSDFDASNWHIDRKQLDATLRSVVGASGVEIEQAKATRIDLGPDMIECSFSNGRNVTCGLLIDATGRTRGPVPRTRHLISPPLLVSTGLIRAERSSIDDTATRFDGRTWGWVWSTSECGRDIAWTAATRADLPRPAEIASTMRRSRTGSVKQSTATWQINLQQHPRILPVGDAAGSLDPASGLGLSNALSTAIWATEVCRCSSGSSHALEIKAASYHSRRIALLLRQADELSRRYSFAGIFQDMDQTEIMADV